MTSSTRPDKPNSPELDACIDKEGHRLMTNRIVLDLHICDAFRVVGTQATPRPRSPVYLARRHRPIRTVPCSSRAAAQTTQYP